MATAHGAIEAAREALLSKGDTEGAGRLLLGAFYESIAEIDRCRVPQDQQKVADVPLDAGEAIRLASLKAWGIDALLEDHAPKAAKAIEIEVAQARPLAICVAGGLFIGRPPLRETWRRTKTNPDSELEQERKRRRLHKGLLAVNLEVFVEGEYHRETIHLPYRGCGRIFADTDQGSRHPWRTMCDECQGRTGRREKQIRDLRRAYTPILQDKLSRRRN
jgi:hypothetical protein